MADSKDKDAAVLTASDSPTKAEQKAVADQQAVDQERGFRAITGHAGRPMFQSLITGHTEETERAMYAYHAELPAMNIVDPR